MCGRISSGGGLYPGGPSAALYKGSFVRTRCDADYFFPNPSVVRVAPSELRKDLMAAGTPYDENYATCIYTHAWLRVMGPEVDPEELTAIVGVQPTAVQRRGDPVEREAEKTYSRGGWWISSEGVLESKDARHHLDWILEKVAGKESAFMELHGRDYLVDLCVRWDSRRGHGGPTISPKQMKALADLGIDLWFDVYVGELED